MFQHIGKSFSEVGAKIHSAFSKIGFVYMTHSGIDESAVSRVFSSSRKFFELSDAAKQRHPQSADMKQGYVYQGKEMLDNLKEEPGEVAAHEARESYDVSFVDGSDRAHFPDDVVPDLRKDVAHLAALLTRAARRVFVAIAHSLGIEEDFFLNVHRALLSGDGSMSKLRSLYYPPLTGMLSKIFRKPTIIEKSEYFTGAIEPGVTRCGEHSDYGTLTFLFQDSLGGLQGRHSPIFLSSFYLSSIFSSNSEF
jgi:isopenicillin N synthase-like dioxygenase